jgi:hypothetical protein
MNSFSSAGISVLGLANKTTFTFIESLSSLDTFTWVHTYKLVKAIPLQARTGPEGTRRLKLPNFKTFST